MAQSFYVELDKVRVAEGLDFSEAMALRDEMAERGVYAIVGYDLF